MRVGARTPHTCTGALFHGQRTIYARKEVGDRQRLSGLESKCVFSVDTQRQPGIGARAAVLGGRRAFPSGATSRVFPPLS